MESDGGVAAITPQRITSQHSTLRESFVASDLAESLDNIVIITNTATSTNNNSDRRIDSFCNQRPTSTVTLGAVLNCDKKSPAAHNAVVRTLLDIIQNEETLHNSTSPRSPCVGKKSWKSFKERLKRRRASVHHSSNQNQNPNSRHWTSSVSVPQSDVLLPNSRGVMNANRNSLRNSLRSGSLRRVDGVPADDLSLREVDSGGSPRSGGSFRLSAALAAEREQTRRRLSRELEGSADEEEFVDSPSGIDEGDGDNEEETRLPDLGPPGGQPMRMSLMDLLEETDRQAGISGPTYRLESDEEEEEEEEVVVAVEPGEETGAGEHSCCVCMVRHKGAAFIPCGHTFCRLCSRELFVQRGNCPLCNNFIVEILDIF